MSDGRADHYEEVLNRSLERAELARRQVVAAGSPPVSDILRTLFEKSPDGMFISTVSGRFILVNAALGRLVGYPPAELMTLPTQAVYAQPSERRRFRGTIEAAGRVNNFRLTLKARNQAEIPVVIDAVVWRRADGRIGGYVGEVRPAARAIEVRGVLSEYDLAVRGASEGLWSWDLKSDEMHYTERFKSILGYEEHEVHNTLHEWIGRIHRDDVERFKTALKDHLRRARDAFLCYFRMIHRDGEYRWMLARGVAQFSEDGAALRMGGSLSNVSSHLEIITRLRGEQEALQSEKQLAARQRDLFAQYIPEELREELADTGEDHAHSRNQDAAVLVARIEEAEFYHARLSAERFASFLNEIVTDISDLVHGHRGVIARVEGDLLVCGFGMVKRRADDVEQCFQAAAAVVKYSRLYNDVRDPGLAKPVSITMGISFGQVFSGTVGNVHRLEFATYGPPIKRAQLLQSRCQRLGTQVLADRAAASRAGSDPELETITLEQSSGNITLYTIASSVPDSTF
ncbi:MAG: PAS domain-containing protein [Spirochaetales bacterium]